MPGGPGGDSALGKPEQIPVGILEMWASPRGDLEGVDSVLGRSGPGGPGGLGMSQGGPEGS